MNNSLAIFLTEPFDNQILKSYKDFFIAEGFDNVFVIADNNVDVPKELGVLPSFYLKFFRGSVLFVDIDNCMIHKDSILADNIYLHASLEHLLQSNISRASVKNIKLINIQNSAVEVSSL